MIEIEPVVFKKTEFEYQQTSVLTTLSAYQKSDASKTRECLKKNFQENNSCRFK